MIKKIISGDLRLEIRQVSEPIAKPQYQVYPYKKEKREILSSTHAFSFMGLSAQ
jgi:hypothetical protein